MKKSDHRRRRLLRARRERPCGSRAAERGYQFSPSDDDWHVTLPCEGCTRSIPRRERAVLLLRERQDADVIRALCPVSALACHGRAYGLVERAADALHCAGIDAEPFGNDAHTGPPRSRQGLTDSFFQRGTAQAAYPRSWPGSHAKAGVPSGIYSDRGA
jgi:hypothetical protein